LLARPESGLHVEDSPPTLPASFPISLPVIILHSSADRVHCRRTITSDPIFVARVCEKTSTVHGRMTAKHDSKDTSHRTDHKVVAKIQIRKNYCFAKVDYS
jgi:hypothetical protein